MSCRRHDQHGHAIGVSGAGRSLTTKRRPSQSGLTFGAANTKEIGKWDWLPLQIKRHVMAVDTA